MRICADLLCDEAAEVWWHGAWCPRHADKRFGRVPMYVGKLEAESLSRRPNGGLGTSSEVPSSGSAASYHPSDAALPISEASRGHRELRVVYTDGTTRRLGTFPDTAHGRERGDKAFQKAREQGWLDLEKVTRLELVPMGAGQTGQEASAERQVHLAESSPAPIRTSDLDAALANHPAGGARCIPGAYVCEPRMLRTPSGVRLCHSRFCPVSPGEPIDLQGYVGAGVRAGVVLPRRGWRGTRW